MRVTHIITRLIVGGAQENTLASVLGLREKPGVEVRLISGPTSGPEGSLEPLALAIPNLLTIVPELVRPLHPWKDLLAWRRLTRILRDQRPDIVHTHSGKAGFLGRLAARRAEVPVIIHTIHGPSFGPFQGSVPNFLFRTAERMAGRITDHFVVVAEAMARQYLDAGIGEPGRYTRIWSGFPLKPFLQSANDLGMRKVWGLAPGHCVIGKIARLTRLKGHDDLFAVAPEVAREAPHVRFLLVGSGDLEGAFREQAARLGLSDRFVFTGLLPPDEVPRAIGIMDLVVHLSRREGLARALPQALAAGKPIVAYDCDGAGEVCLDNQTGFLVPPGDLARLREKVLRLVREPGLRDRLGQCGRAFVQERFSVERMVGDLYQLYRQMVDR